MDPENLWIPLEFWFNRDARLALPFIAIHDVIPERSEIPIDDNYDECE